MLTIISYALRSSLFDLCLTDHNQLPSFCALSQYRDQKSPVPRKGDPKGQMLPTRFDALSRHSILHSCRVTRSCFSRIMINAQLPMLVWFSLSLLQCNSLLFYNM